MNESKSDSSSKTPIVFFTDRQLCARWSCCSATLRRARLKGKLKSFRRGGTGPYLTEESEAIAYERGCVRKEASDDMAAA